MSIALRHQQKVLAKRQAEEDRKKIAQASADTVSATATEYNEFQLLLDSLEQDVERLHGLSVDDKNQIRRDELIPKYRPYCRDYLKKEEVYKNPVMVQLLIWLFDVEDIHEGLFWAYAAIEQQQPMPERFKRDLTTFVADKVLEWAELQQQRGGSLEPYFSDVFQRLTEQKWPMPDVVRAKYFVKAGDLALEAGKLQQALDCFLRALELDSKVQRKTKIKKIRSELAKQKQASE